MKGSTGNSERTCRISGRRNLEFQTGLTYDGSFNNNQRDTGEAVNVIDYDIYSGEDCIELLERLNVFLMYNLTEEISFININK